MTTLAPHRQIAALRKQRGETLAQFAEVLGCSSKSRIWEFENGRACPTVAQAVRLEELSGGKIDAAALNEDVARSRRVLGVFAQRTHDGTSAIDDCAAPAGGWELSDQELATIPERIVVCEVCDARLDGMCPVSCTFVDCPHARKEAA